MSGPETDPRSAASPAARGAAGSAARLPLSPERAAARARLAACLETSPIDLMEASLWIAAEEYPSIDVDRYVRGVDAMGREIAKRTGAILNPFARLDALREYLFEELGFRGNSEQYDDAKNSYLNDVLDRRLGIPLSLSIVYLEVARRAGFEARGVGLPGHFIVRVDEQGRQILIDPFHGGRVITPEDCRDLVIRTTGRGALFKHDVLDGTTERAMLARLLLNLKRIHLAQGDYSRALGVVERLLVVQPAELKEVRDRGLLLAHLGHTADAVNDLEAYLAMAPDAADADSVRGRLAWILRKLTEVH